MIIEETKRDKIRIRVGERAMQYEERTRNAMSMIILKESLKEEKREATKTKNIQKKQEYLMRNGYNRADQLRKPNVTVVKTLNEKDKEVQKQTQYNKWKVQALIEFLETEGRGGSQRLIARARCGNLEEGNKHWLEMEKRRCVLCQTEEGTLNLLLDEYVATLRESIRVEEVVSGKINVKVEEWLRDLKKKKKKKHLGCRVEEHKPQIHKGYITIYL